MSKREPGMAQQIAQAACDFQRQRVGRAPKSVTVVLSADTLVITMRGALSPAEQAVAKSPQGAARVQEFHRLLFDSSSESMREEIERITGVQVGEAAGEYGPAAVVQAFTNGTMVQVFLLARGVADDTWTMTKPA